MHELVLNYEGAAMHIGKPIDADIATQIANADEHPDIIVNTDGTSGWDNPQDTPTGLVNAGGYPVDLPDTDDADLLPPPAPVKDIVQNIVDLADRQAMDNAPPRADPNYGGMPPNADPDLLLPPSLGNRDSKPMTQKQLDAENQRRMQLIPGFDSAPPMLDVDD